MARSTSDDASQAEEDADSSVDALDAPLGALGSQVQGSEEDDADADGSGRMDFAEFVALSTRALLRCQALQQAARIVCADADLPRKMYV